MISSLNNIPTNSNIKKPPRGGMIILKTIIAQAKAPANKKINKFYYRLTKILLIFYQIKKSQFKKKAQ